MRMLASPEETAVFAAQLARVCAQGDCLLLIGDLGAGKTAFARGFIRALQEAPTEVTSPTFTLVHEYRGPERTVYHIDLYRLDTERELTTLGLEDMSNEEGAILLIEWGEKFERLRKLRDVEIVLERTGEDSRKINVYSND